MFFAEFAFLITYNHTFTVPSRTSVGRNPRFCFSQLPTRIFDPWWCQLPHGSGFPEVSGEHMWKWGGSWGRKNIMDVVLIIKCLIIKFILGNGQHVTFRFNDTPHLHHHCSGVMFSWGRGSICPENLVTQHRERSSKNTWIWLTQGSWMFLGQVTTQGFYLGWFLWVIRNLA